MLFYRPRHPAPKINHRLIDNRRKVCYNKAITET